MEIEGSRLSNFDNPTIIRTLHASRGLVLYKHTLTGDKHVFTHKRVTVGLLLKVCLCVINMRAHIIHM